MKTKYFLLSLLVILFSCDKLPINGLLDGMWQLKKIEYTNGETIFPEFTYYSIQLDLIKLSQVHNSGTPDRSINTFLGRFQYTHDSLYIYDIRTWVYREEEIPATVEQLQPFGISNNAHFAIEKLDGKNMLLRSDEALLTFRKF